MHPPVIGDEEQKVLEKFVITMYDRSSQATDIDAVRLDMFTRKERPYDQLGQLWFNILSELHIRQAVFGVSRHYVIWNLEVLVNGVGSSKITLGKYCGQPYHQLPTAVGWLYWV